MFIEFISAFKHFILSLSHAFIGIYKEHMCVLEERAVRYPKVDHGTSHAAENLEMVQNMLPSTLNSLYKIYKWPLTEINLPLVAGFLFRISTKMTWSAITFKRWIR